MYKRPHLKSESCLDLALILRTWRMNTLLQVDIIKSDLWTLIIMQVVPSGLLNVLLSHCKNLGDQRERFWISNVGKKKFFPPTFIFGRTGLLEAEALLTNSCFTCSNNFLKNFKFNFNMYVLHPFTVGNFRFLVHALEYSKIKKTVTFPYEFFKHSLRNKFCEITAGRKWNEN